MKTTSKIKTISKMKTIFFSEGYLRYLALGLTLLMGELVSACVFFSK